MPRQTPADLADEIRDEGGQWCLSFARFRPPGGKDAPSFRVSIAVNGANLWSDIALDSRPLRDARSAVDALKRSGYEILSNRSRPFHARRPLRGPRELDAEVRRLEGLPRDRAALRAFPSRAPRPAGLPAGFGPLSMAAFDRLRKEHGWVLEGVSVGRQGSAPFPRAPAWSIGAWCYLVDDGGDRWLNLHVQLFQKRPGESVSDSEFERLAREFRKRFEPLGYLPVKLRGTKDPAFAVLNKSVCTLPAARRERRRLDRVLLGD